MNIWHKHNRMPTQTLRLVWVVSYVIFLGINFASNLGWLGATNAQVSRKYAVPLTPASWAFSIWICIFILQGIGTVAIFWGHYDPDGGKQRLVNTLGPCWVGCWWAAVGWQLSFSREAMYLATAMILLSLTAMMYGLACLYKQNQEYGPSNSGLLYVAFILPTSILAAWLSVASSVQLLISISFSTVHVDQYAAVLALCVCAGGLVVLLSHKDTAYGATLLWALVAVWEHSPSPLVRHIALVAIIFLTLGCLASVLKRRPTEELQATVDVEAQRLLHDDSV